MPGRAVARSRRLSGRPCFAATAATPPSRPPTMNKLPASLVLPSMRIHRRKNLPGAITGRQGHPTDTPARHRRWRPRRRMDPGDARLVPGAGAVQAQTAPGETEDVATAPGETLATAVQLAIGLLTASLDSPGLEAWAVDVLPPHDADGLADFMAGLHLVSELLLHELCEATGEPPEAVLQRLALLAEHWRGTSPAG
jgi:hypothetical protein